MGWHRLVQRGDQGARESDIIASPADVDFWQFVDVGGRSECWSVEGCGSWPCQNRHGDESQRGSRVSSAKDGMEGMERMPTNEDAARLELTVGPSSPRR